MKAKLTNVITPGGWNLLDSLIEQYGGKRSDYQSGEVLDDGGSHYLIKFRNGVEQYINKGWVELIP